ncbi:hypothetical protein [Enterobacter quasimori]|uniref:hypothetical protein n=1 Tax=Enterobacter quasimori TaxID=2838947 RepID=UPI001C0BC6CB|nr:hypothetical protein [Enterobacter quasimori]MBT1729026.1 hypothetical protein [Enterobacter quasimori]
MKKINYLDKKDVYDELMLNFPVQFPPLLSDDMKGLDDSELVYTFFSGNQWNELADNLLLNDNSYALELGILFLPEKVFCYYIPLYIYASLFNKNEFWVFESDFIQQYLCPEYRDHDDFLNFILDFSDSQLFIIAQFMSFESKNLALPYVNKACVDFWDDYL